MEAVLQGTVLIILVFQLLKLEIPNYHQDFHVTRPYYLKTPIKMEFNLDIVPLIDQISYPATLMF